MRLSFPAAVAALTLPALAAAGEAQDRLHELLATRLDGTRCWRVRDLYLEREDLKFYLTDGVLILAQPFREREIAAFFLAKEPTDLGEVILVPPTPGERQSLARFTKDTALNEKFRSAVFLFTDDTAERLLGQIRERGLTADAAEGAALAERWSSTLRNILEGVALRLLHDTLSEIPSEQGFFAAAVGGGPRGRFDLTLDPQLREQLSVGRAVQSGGRRTIETWCRFPARSFRQGREPRRRGVGALEDYRIEADLDDELTMRAVASARYRPYEAGDRTFALELSNRLKPTAVRLNGQPADYIGMEQFGGAVERDNAVIFVLSPEPMSPAAPPAVEVEYEGRIVSRAGPDVFFVGSRGVWYPRADAGFTHYELTFRAPARLEVVATGEPVGEPEEASDGRRVSRFRTEAPIRTAGFNLGAYERAAREVNGYTVEVRANRSVEDRLLPRPRTIIAPDPLALGRGGPRSRQAAATAPVAVTTTPPPPPAPAANIQALADADAAAFAHFVERFGPPPARRVVVSPIPAGFGQGLPGLVYAATLSYFKPDAPPLAGLSEWEREFYTDLLRPHEIAHQWWGNGVGVSSGRDLWFMEALATYSSLLHLERTKGPKAMRATLDRFRANLLAKTDGGEPLHAAGPPTMGERLIGHGAPHAYHTILYEKGAWIFHMLRGVLGDERFFALLASVAETYRFRDLTTEDFRREAARFVPADCADRDLADFFDQWVEGTDIPRLAVEASAGKAGVAGVLRQSGVDDSFTATVRLRAHFADRAPADIAVTTDGDETEFVIPATGKLVRIEIDPEGYLLAVKR